jgi:hypothetical protein
MLGELYAEVAHRVRRGLALHRLVLEQVLGDTVEVEPVGLRELLSPNRSLRFSMIRDSGDGSGSEFRKSEAQIET